MGHRWSAAIVHAAGRYRAYITIAVAVALIVWFPGGSRSRPGPAPTGGASEMSRVPAAVGTPSGASPAGSGVAPSAGLIGTAGAVSMPTSSRASSMSSPTPTGDVSPPPSGSGIGTPAALAAPNCDTARHRIRVSFSWAAPCVAPWPAGADNGGPTAPGVERTTVRLVIYNNYVGSPPTENDPTTLAEWATIDQLWEHFYEMWGRHVVASVVDETGSDDVSQHADAVAIENQHPFAVLNVPAAAQVLISALAAQHIVSITSGNISVKDSLTLAPYVWGTTIQADELVALNAADYVGHRLLGRTAHWAGEADFQIKPRKFAIVYPATWDLGTFRTEFSRFGGRLADSFGYQAGQQNASLWAEEARTVASRFKSEGITSVIAATDLLFTGPLTQAAASEDWSPEWIMTGYDAQDLSIVAATYNQAEWSHAFGVCGIPVPGTPAYPQIWFYNWYWGSKGSTDVGTQTMQGEAVVLFTGINDAGPALTPSSFQAGMFAMPATGGAATGGIMTAQYGFGHVPSIPWPYYNAFDDFDECYWDPTAVAPNIVTHEPSVGQYRHLNGGRRYLVTQWPSSEPAMFQSAGTAVWYDAYPPGDVPPSYPCRGCPSTTS